LFFFFFFFFFKLEKRFYSILPTVGTLFRLFTISTTQLPIKIFKNQFDDCLPINLLLKEYNKKMTSCHSKIL